ncbi:hypothetical protein CEP51_015908 [Fusarium floridanum]|uniref:Uncharacterized protein n=1 Tax=Fusarium floridanum TaxID=1325733 RepID=A0A428P0N8_9HYPO|nr:hypothetical protein CEP51_015908 [Fusarium floridanum]
MSDTLLAAGEYTYEPPAEEERRRFTRTRRLLAPKLNHVLQMRLPPEILTTIAGLLVRECAVITSEEQSLGKNASNTLVDLSRDVYASYYVVDGVRYATGLSNSIDDLSEDKHHVLVRKAGQSMHKIWIAEDHRGIRCVRFCSSDAILPAPTPIARSWWRYISASDGIEEITVKTDGIKLRDILVPGETASEITNNYVGWASPQHPTDIMDLRTLGHLNEYPERLRMNSFICNAKGTTGYTVATHGHSVAMIPAHGLEDDTRFYVEMNAGFSKAFLAYMPLDEGEYVTEICRRYALGPLNRPSVCLVFITNKSRNALFGTSGPPESCRVLDKLLTPAPDGSRIFYNACDSVLGKSIKYLAFEGTQSPTQRPFPASLIPNSPFFWTQSNEPWFVSSCHMEGVVDVTLCRDTSLAHQPILGMLLENENGHRDCLGQFRYDKPLQKVRVDQTAKLYIGSGRTTGSYLYVADVLTFPPTDRDELAWIEVCWQSTLEWWSSLRHSVLRHTSAKGQVTNMETSESILYSA